MREASDVFEAEDARHRAAKLRLDLAQRALERSVLRAGQPVLITQVHVIEGSGLFPNDVSPALSVIPADEFAVELRLPESQAGSFQPGTSITLEHTGENSGQLKARVVDWRRSTESATAGSVLIRAYVRAPQSSVLHAGDEVRLHYPSPGQ